ncbi:MAG TPA: RNase adapter RapZ [Desulfobacterales bacterium]|nr:RNase adapter RapZ [Desulfobacterales bacterium]
MIQLKIIIITGLSGSGKSTAIAAYEDAGFYCVDNMPVALLPKFLEMPIENVTEISGLAFVMDLREKGFITTYTSVFESLRQKGYDYEILFLEADENVLLQRYSQTRRHHPLSEGESLIDSIRAEKKQLEGLKKAADNVINTSRYNEHKLKSVIFDVEQKTKQMKLMTINVQSFGYKYGVPLDVDLLIDVRFLINPYFVPELKELDGESARIKKYILDHGETKTFLQKYLSLLDYLIPLYENEGKAYLTIGVGCTGGRHRSVTIARVIFEHINKKDKQIKITHRDIGR